MKKVLILALILSGFLLLNSKISAQSGQNISIAKIESKEQKIELTLSSNYPFYVGGNRYVLHIGENYFLKSKHPDGNINLLTFILSKKEFKELDNKSTVTLAYGFNKSNIGATDFKGKHWKVGEINKDILNK